MSARSIWTIIHVSLFGYIKHCTGKTSSVWHPAMVGLIDIIEQVQRYATRTLADLKGLTYDERLRQIKLPTLAYRLHRGDMIETYKSLHHKCDSSVSPKL